MNGTNLWLTLGVGFLFCYCLFDALLPETMGQNQQLGSCGTNQTIPTNPVSSGHKTVLIMHAIQTLYNALEGIRQNMGNSIYLRPMEVVSMRLQ